MSASLRGLATGLMGSAAVLGVAALSLSSSAHATGDAKTSARAATAGAQVQPAAGPTPRAALRPVWLKRLLSRTDLEGVRNRS